ncbi:MAG: hypothetical protein IJN03_01760 [Bacilli bacterium]|nr:hypothetical protein [Bacilli bacterium]
MAKKKSLKYIPTKNYIIAALLIAVSIFLVFYLFEWYKVKQIDKYGRSYLMESNTLNLEIKSFEEIPIVLMEAPSDYFVFINYLNEKANYKLEKNLKKIIDDYNLKDIFYYMNVTDIREKDDDYINNLNKHFNSDDKIKNVPVILYYRSGKLTEVINSNEDNIISASELKKILEIYEIKKP